MDALVGLYQASDEMDAALFTPFSEEILQDYRFIDSLQYLTYITREEEQLFSEEMHDSGFSQFSIKGLEPGNGARMIPDHHLVASFLEPLTPSSANLMGLDWLTDDDVARAFYRAAGENRGQLIVAPPGLGKTRHLVLLKPTYFGRSIQTDADDRFEQTSGMFAILLDWNQLTGLAQPEDGRHLPVEFSLLTEDGEKFSHHEPGETEAIETSIEAGNLSLRVMAHYHLHPTREMFIWVFVAGLLTATVYTILGLALRSRYLLLRERNRAQALLYCVHEIFERRE